jgi:3-oxoacyl-[acyl-carrier-protein] synthase II
MKRVAVTGLGLVSPLGNDVSTCWQAALAGRSGISAITDPSFADSPVRIGGFVKDFRAADHMDEKESRRTQKFVHFAVAAARMALRDAGLGTAASEHPQGFADHLGVAIGVGVGGLGYMEENILAHAEKGPRGVSPFTIPGFIANMAAGIVSMETGARGPNTCTTTACASGTHAIGDAMMMIQTGRAKAMVAGGSESAMSKFAFSSFARMKALCSDANERPTEASRPFDKTRSGFVMGEGAGVVVLEEMEAARARGARIYCELVGFGMSGDAYHMTAPSEGGDGARRCMEQALRSGGLNPEDIDHINAHGTSTPANDKAESEAIRALFGPHAERLAICSTKSMTGHLLGAAGGVEAVLTALAMHHGVIPPTTNLREPDPECGPLNFVPLKAQERAVRAALSNSFGFGGTNACLAFRRV